MFYYELFKTRAGVLHECFMRYKTRGASERFIPDEARIASVINSVENDAFYPHLVTVYERIFDIVV